MRDNAFMANLGQMSGRSAGGQLAPPVGQIIARYRTYGEAQRAVDFLSDSRFPVQAVTIVGTDLRSVERVTGRLTYGRVALAGALSGAWFGLFVGLVLSWFGGGPDAGVMAAVLIGAGFGMLFAVISYAATGGHRDFTSQSAIVASEYQVLCRDDQARAAMEVLGRLPNAAPGGATSPPPLPEPVNPYAPPRGPTEPQSPPQSSAQQPAGPPSEPASPVGGSPSSGGWGQPSASPYGRPPVQPSAYPQPAAPDAAATPAEVPAEPAQPVVTGLTYGEVMEQRRREQRARDAAERARRAAEEKS
jgi:pyruvate/2-oxoglutarate dehydrogenase complex dihydrolipoamide acyltransferase (E2) component